MKVQAKKGTDKYKPWKINDIHVKQELQYEKIIQLIPPKFISVTIFN
jgi:hypothetical protein